MRFWKLIVLLAIGCLPLLMGSTTIPVAPVATDRGLENLRLKLNPEFPSWSPGYVIERVAERLATVQAIMVRDGSTEAYAKHEASYLRFFDLSDIPRSRLPEGIAALLFWSNSMSSAPVVARPQAVPQTDNRLFWIDLRWFNWTVDAWERVSLEDPYFREPLVPSDSKGLHYMKSLIGNGVIRGGWFLYYAADATQFLKANQTKADNAFYYILLYASNFSVTKVKERQKKLWKGGTDSRGNTFPAGTPYEVEVEVEKKTPGKVPQNVQEFQKFWRIDQALKDARDFNADRGAVVDEKESIVAYQNRVMHRVRTNLGTYWRSYDVFRSVGDQDFLEALPIPPKKFDAGEHIFQDPKGAQYYFLSNGTAQGEDRVEFGDPRVVRDQMSGEKLVVITAKSCVSCHERGIIPIRNEALELGDVGAKLKAKDPYEYAKLKAFYFQNLQRLVKIDQDEYVEFIRQCNGLTPEENAVQFQRLRTWYIAPLNVHQAAREVGAVDTKEFMDAVQIGTKGRIGRLILDGKPIPRTVWEYGGYAESFLLLLEYRRAAKIPLR